MAEIPKTLIGSFAGNNRYCFFSEKVQANHKKDSLEKKLFTKYRFLSTPSLLRLNILWS